MNLHTANNIASKLFNNNPDSTFFAQSVVMSILSDMSLTDDEKTNQILETIVEAKLASREEILKMAFYEVEISSEEPFIPTLDIGL